MLAGQEGLDMVAVRYHVRWGGSIGLPPYSHFCNNHTILSEPPTRYFRELSGPDLEADNII